MFDALIYRPVKTPTQSGLKTACWHLSFVPQKRQILIDPVMRWHSQEDTHKQIEINFTTLEAALAYAKAHQLSVHVQEDVPRAPAHPHSYAEHLLKPHMRS